MNKIISFLKESKEEILKVNWPSKKKTTDYTIAVIVMSLSVAIFLGILDLIFSKSISKFIF